MHTVFVNATVIDGIGSVYERHNVHVEHDVITKVEPARSDSLESPDRVIDLDGMVLMPGLIDTHLHFGGGDYDPAFEHDSVGLASLRSIDAIQRCLLAGFTTIRSAGARDHLDIDARDAVNQGEVFGPRVIASGRGITMTGGHFHDVAYEVDGVDEIIKAARTLIKRGADSIKIFAISPGVATAGNDLDTAAFSVDEIRAAVVEARKAKKLTQTHSISLQGTKNAIEAGVHSIDHGIFLDEEACQAMIDTGTYLVPTFGPLFYYTVRRLAEPWRSKRAEQAVEPHRESFRMALEMGVNIAMGSDLGAPSRMKSGENAVELELMVNNGMRAEDVIVASTSAAADLLDLDDSLGSITAGKLADLIVVGRNPIDDITALQTDVRLVMRSGVVYRDDMDS